MLLGLGTSTFVSKALCFLRLFSIGNGPYVFSDIYSSLLDLRESAFLLARAKIPETSCIDFTILTDVKVDFSNQSSGRDRFFSFTRFPIAGFNSTAYTFLHFYVTFLLPQVQ